MHLANDHLYYDCCYHRDFDRHGNIINLHGMHRAGNVMFDCVEHTTVLWLSIMGLALPDGWRTDYQPWLIFVTISR